MKVRISPLLRALTKKNRLVPINDVLLTITLYLNVIDNFSIIMNITDSFESFFELLESVRPKIPASTKSFRTTRRDSTLTPREGDSMRDLSVFDKLHYESVELKDRRLRREFESKKRKEQEERVCCTFRPNSNPISVV